eukprot:7974539-Pyramimonas_sp.AAC.2
MVQFDEEDLVDPVFVYLCKYTLENSHGYRHVYSKAKKLQLTLDCWVDTGPVRPTIAELAFRSYRQDHDPGRRAAGSISAPQRVSERFSRDEHTRSYQIRIDSSFTRERSMQPTPDRLDFALGPSWIPRSLTPGLCSFSFEWCECDMRETAEVDEVYKLLNLNYVEDDDNMFRCGSIALLCPPLRRHRVFANQCSPLPGSRVYDSQGSEDPSLRQFGYLVERIAQYGETTY